MSADPIPAIVEADATGETSLLFADLRATLGVPFVNLIWRHLATIPGGLGWTWRLLRPVYLSTELQAASEQLRDGIALSCTPLDAFIYDAAGLDPAARSGIAALVADYNRANGLNFLALQVACRVLRGAIVPSAAAFMPTPGSAAPAVPVSVPRLPGLDEFPASLRALMLDFDQFGRIAPSDAIGSLFRHLGHWPAFLALAHTALLPLHRDGSLQSQQELLISRAGALVTDRLVPLLQGVPAALGPAENARILAGLDEFTRLMIGRMMVTGTALSALLPHPDAAAGIRT